MSDRRHGRHLSHFWRHFLEMLAIMVAGMIATAAVFLSVVGLKTWNGRRNSYEMALAMVLPVIPFLCLVWFDVTKSAQCGAYCVLTVAAMLVLMLYRRSEYSMQM
ncbi:MAG: hypothetical protein E6G37_12940 [Actinobacteria bacterium]|nr:MAG: hypothetical protein E6G37_12940 [Actinomycetota bacterium]